MGHLTTEHKVVIVNAPAGYLKLLKPGPAEIAPALAPSQTYDAVVQRDVLG